MTMGTLCYTSMPSIPTSPSGSRTLFPTLGYTLAHILSSLIDCTKFATKLLSYFHRSLTGYCTSMECPFSHCNSVLDGGPDPPPGEREREVQLPSGFQKTILLTFSGGRHLCTSWVLVCPRYAQKYSCMFLWFTVYTVSPKIHVTTSSTITWTVSIRL